eukprot:SAG31_NODE_12_length_38498_cov_21.161671_27_plen_111_part_00
MSLESVQTKQVTRKNVERKLANMEQKIYDLESRYLEETATTGNVLVGFQNYLKKDNKAAQAAHRSQHKRKQKEDERMFSKSSCTAPGSTFFLDKQPHAEEESSKSRKKRH